MTNKIKTRKSNDKDLKTQKRKNRNKKFVSKNETKFIFILKLLFE